MGSSLDTTLFTYNLCACDSPALGNMEAINSLPLSGLLQLQQQINRGKAEILACAN